MDELPRQKGNGGQHSKCNGAQESDTDPGVPDTPNALENVFEVIPIGLHALHAARSPTSGDHAGTNALAFTDVV